VGSWRERYHDLVAGKSRGVLPAVQRVGLRLLSAPYGLGVRLRNWLFDRGWKRVARAAVPVVSIGNLTLGGTGKTPCVEYVARYYRGLDVRAAILSRGYGAEVGVNDEALVLEENLPDVPHLQGADRAQLARIAVEELESEVLVLDDGFQHRRLARTLDVVLIDATAPFGHDHLFPRGLLREPVTGLRRARVALLTRCDQVDAAAVAGIRQRVLAVAPGLTVAETIHQPAEWVNADGATLPVAGLAGRPVAAFCGLGNPEGFRRTLQQLGATPTEFRTYPDHHQYTRADVEELRSWSRQQATECVVVTTQKDLVKLRLSRLGDRALWALRIRLAFTAGQDEFDRTLKEALG
jgi:tetraacyldisaccharide 4'-kinase